jgi:hypothetical protein
MCLVSCHRNNHRASDRWGVPYLAERVPAEVNANLGALATKVVATANSGHRRELEQLIATDRDIAALGRFIVTLSPADIGKFKTRPGAAKRVSEGEDPFSLLPHRLDARQVMRRPQEILVHRRHVAEIDGLILEIDVE